MFRKLIPFFLVAFLLALFVRSYRLANVLLKKPSTQESVPSDSLRLGIVLPLTGSLAGFGKQAQDGMNLAFIQLQKQGLKLDLHWEDTQSKTQGATEAMHKLHLVHHLPFVIGEISSENTEAAAAYAKANKIFLLSPGSGHNHLTDHNPWVARICFNNRFQSKKMAQFAYKNIDKQNIKKNKPIIAIIEQKGSLFSQENAQGFKEAFLALGGDISNHLFFSPKDTDFKVLLKTLKKSGTQHVYLPDYYPQAAQWVKQSAELNMGFTFYGVDGWESPEFFNIAAKGSAGHYILSHFSAQNPDPQVQSFVKDFKAYYGYVPGVLDALGYDSLKFAIHALKKAQETKTPLLSSSLRSILFSIKDFSGVTGSIRLDPKGNAIKPGVILKTLNQGYEFIENVESDSLSL